MSSRRAGYLPHARLLIGDDVLRVRELDFLSRGGAPRRCDIFYGQSCFIPAIDNPLPPEFKAAFTHVEQARTPDFLIDRYTSRMPVEVQANHLVHPSWVPDSSVLYVPAR